MSFRSTRVLGVLGPASGLALLAMFAMGQGPPPTLGEPLSGLTKQQRNRFLAGKAAFEDNRTKAEGRGPVFNGRDGFNTVSCVTCHADPVAGGASEADQVRFGRVVDGRFDPMTEFGGSHLQSRGLAGLGGEAVPPEATIVSPRRTTPLFGLGLVDAVPDDTFLAIAEHQRLNTPETAGRPNMVRDLVNGGWAVGKFGWKAHIPSLLQFAGDASLNEMGITSPLFPEENCPGGDCSLLSFDEVPDPEIGDRELYDLAIFMTLLAPPPRGPITSQVRAGENVFRQVGCADCHLPDLMTGPNAIAALDRKAFHPYSDFLIHDMGELGENIRLGQARRREMRTAPLWGVRSQFELLHDRRAGDLEGAILEHRGQGQGARDRFEALNANQKNQLLAFLNSL